MSELVKRVDEEGIATLSLDRPDVLNALSPALFEGLRAHIDAIAAETETVGCVILRGEGRSFSSGNDLGAITAGERAPSVPRASSRASSMSAATPEALSSAPGWTLSSQPLPWPS